MRHLIDSVQPRPKSPNFLLECERLVEDQPRRLHDPGVVEWLNAARDRPDANELYVHGSNKIFDRFQQPNTDNGQLIFASKLNEFNQWPDATLQAEYYGKNLYLVRMNLKRRFDPLNDPKAKEIMATALDGEYRWEWSEDGETRIYHGVWGFDDKMKYGMLDYQDCHLVVPPAVQAGYDFFRVYEVSMRGFSYASAAASIVEIVDRYPK